MEHQRLLPPLIRDILSLQIDSLYAMRRNVDAQKAEKQLLLLNEGCACMLDCNTLNFRNEDPPDWESTTLSTKSALDYRYWKK